MRYVALTKERHALTSLGLAHPTLAGHLRDMGDMDKSRVDAVRTPMGYFQYYTVIVLEFL
jgi:hypothetical protein